MRVEKKEKSSQFRGQKILGEHSNWDAWDLVMFLPKVVVVFSEAFRFQTPIIPRPSPVIGQAYDTVSDTWVRTACAGKS